ncbi:MAG: orotate phosphoribosyltransferase-like protein [archaeon]
MRSLEDLVKKAQELKSKGLTTHEISDELKVQADTVVWLLFRGKERQAKPAPFDVFVDWNQIGSSVRRISCVGSALADLAREAVASGEFEDPQIVAAVEGSGVVLGMTIAQGLNRPLAIVRPYRVADKKIPGAINPSFASVEDKKVLIVDSVVMQGETIRAAIQTAKASKAKPIGVVALISKSGREDIDGVPFKPLIRLLSVSKS